MCFLLLVCAGLRTPHLGKHILNEEECRSVRETKFWYDKLAIAIAVKPFSVVQETLDVLGEDVSCYLTAKPIENKLCTTWQLVLVC